MDELRIGFLGNVTGYETGGLPEGDSVQQALWDLGKLIKVTKALKSCFLQVGEPDVQRFLNEMIDTRKNFGYLVILRGQLRAVMLHRIGMRLNRSDLMRAGENHFSRTYYMNCNLPYSNIYSRGGVNGM